MTLNLKSHNLFIFAAKNFHFHIPERMVGDAGRIEMYVRRIYEVKLKMLHCFLS